MVEAEGGLQVDDMLPSLRNGASSNSGAGTQDFGRLARVLEPEPASPRSSPVP